jgi:hypothetical protein
MIDSSIQQMHSFVELLNNVAASLDGFEQSNIGADRARAWLAEHYPDALELSNGSADGEEPFDPEEEPETRRLRLRSGASFPAAERLRIDLGLSTEDDVPSSGDPEQALVPLARRHLARGRQSMLATMVQMGMQRIVVESGRIQASMRFHIDTRDAAARDAGSTFDFRNTVQAGGSFGVGPWGASASMTNTVGYVSTERTQTSAEINTELDLSSSVEINFRSDYLPLDRMATREQAGKIQANSLNPDAEATAASKA